MVLNGYTVFVLCALFFVVGLNVGGALCEATWRNCARRLRKDGRLAETELADGRYMIVMRPKEQRSGN